MKDKGRLILAYDYACSVRVSLMYRVSNKPLHNFKNDHISALCCPIWHYLGVMDSSIFRNS
jgi:hypothetical protein